MGCAVSGREPDLIGRFGTVRLLRILGISGASLGGRFPQMGSRMNLGGRREEGGGGGGGEGSLAWVQ